MTVVTFTGTTTLNQYSGEIISGYLPAFTGAFTLEIRAPSALTGLTTVNFTVALKRSSDGATCWSDGLSIIHGNAAVSNSTTVGGFYGTWSCTDWDQITLHLNSALACPAITWTLTVTGTFVIPYCPYGVQPNPDAPYNTVITTSVLELVSTLALARLGQEDKVPYVTAGLQILAGQVMKTVDCTRLPAPNLITDMTDFNGQHVDALTEWFYNAAWHYFCRCTPAPAGHGDPTPPPPPDVVLPVDVTFTAIPLVCDNSDVCTILNSIMKKLDSLTANVSYTRRDLQTVQRQAAPFAYIPGPIFTALSGGGEVAVSDILALSVQSTTVPSTLGLVTADPEEYRYLGRISLGTDDGWIRQTMISHNPHLILPIEGAITKIGYSFAVGVVANIQCFVMEPLG